MDEIIMVALTGVAAVLAAVVAMLVNRLQSTLERVEEFRAAMMRARSDRDISHDARRKADLDYASAMESVARLAGELAVAKANKDK